MMKNSRFPTNIKYKTRISPLTTYFQHYTGSSGYCNKTRKTNTKYTDWEEINKKNFS